jgi:hypothetical protein
VVSILKQATTASIYTLFFHHTEIIPSERCYTIQAVEKASLNKSIRKIVAEQTVERNL